MRKKESRTQVIEKKVQDLMNNWSFNMKQNNIKVPRLFHKITMKNMFLIKEKKDFGAEINNRYYIQCHIFSFSITNEFFLIDVISKEASY